MNANINLQILVKDSLTQSSNVTPLAVKFLHDRTVQKYAMGRNDDVLAIHKVRPLDGLVDDYFTGKDWNGIPIIKSHQLPPGSIVLNGSTSIAPVKVQQVLSRISHIHSLGLHEVIAAAHGEIEWPHFVTQQRIEIAEHFAVWNAMYEQMADEISRQTLIDVLLFRLTADPRYMREYRVRIEDQYFEPFMDYKEEVFVDAGGYDGDTTEEFTKRYTDYRKVIFFEPSLQNMTAAQNRLSGIRDIEYHSIGLSDSAGMLSFNASLGSASSVQNNGGHSIVVDTLDQAVDEPVTFIKMDLEGWEIKALAGAQRHIVKNRPKLALAVYHQAADFRLIYNYISSFKHDYKVYLRHYTQGWSETVMFFK